MAAQQPGWGQALHLPDGHQRIRACTGELSTIRTPGDVVERDRVALHDVYTLPPLHLPHPQGTIFTATEQAAAVRCEGDIVYTGGMPVQRSEEHTSELQSQFHLVCR